MTDKIDYKKIYKELYLPPQHPVLTKVPPMHFIMVDGSGAPEGASYQSSIQALYALTFTIKMSKMNGTAPAGYFEYTVPPLEGLWWCEGHATSLDRPRSEWQFTSMIRQPEFVTEHVFLSAMEQCRRKKPDVDLSRVRFESFSEGLCVQMMHIGPYSDESRSIFLLEEYMLKNNLANDTGSVRKHHEIYLSNPQRTAPDRLKTVLRLPVSR